MLLSESLAIKGFYVFTAGGMGIAFTFMKRQWCFIDFVFHKRKEKK